MPIRILLSAISFTFSLVFATQGLLQTWTDARQAAAAIGRSQRVLSELSPDPWMAQALPPGAWWELANEMAGSCALSSDEEIEVALANASGRSAVEAACSGNLEFAGVSFSYPTRPGVKVINDLNLVLPRGKITALVGRSGAGKSTVASLIERLYSPDEGAILLDGTPIDTFTRAKWMDAVTAVAQEPVLFSGTIYDNIVSGFRVIQYMWRSLECSVLYIGGELLLTCPPPQFSGICQASGDQRRRGECSQGRECP